MIWQNMIWQDYVITGVVILFSISLLPQVIEGFKKKRGYITLKTSIPTFMGLVVISFAYGTLNLYFSAIMSGIVALMWLLLLIQRVTYEKV